MLFLILHLKGVLSLMPLLLVLCFELLKLLGHLMLAPFSLGLLAKLLLHSCYLLF